MKKKSLQYKGCISWWAELVWLQLNKEDEIVLQMHLEHQQCIIEEESMNYSKLFLFYELICCFKNKFCDFFYIN